MCIVLILLEKLKILVFFKKVSQFTILKVEHCIFLKFSSLFVPLQFFFFKYLIHFRKKMIFFNLEFLKKVNGRSTIFELKK